MVDEDEKNDDEAMAELVERIRTQFSGLLDKPIPADILELLQQLEAEVSPTNEPPDS